MEKQLAGSMIMTENLHSIKPDTTTADEDTCSTANTESLMTMSDLEDHFFAEPNKAQVEKLVETNGKSSGMHKNLDHGDILSHEKKCLGKFSPSEPIYKEIVLDTHHNNKDVDKIENEFLTEKYNSIVYHPYKLVEMKKLEFALKHLGVQFNVQQKNKIRTSLYPDETGRVKYGDFVDSVQSVLNLETFEDHKFILKNKDKTRFSTRKMSPAQHTTNNMLNCVEKIKKATLELGSENLAAFHRSEMERLKRERDTAIMELKKMRNALKEKEQICSLLEDELIDTQTMRKVIEEEELEKKSRETTDNHKQSAVLGCQLHKAELAKQTYEICIEKLISFVEKVQTTVEILLKYSETKSKGHKKLLYLSQKSKDVMNVVKALTDDEPLPYGWEKAYTDDNMCYYVNHATQTTSWIHPLTKKYDVNSNKNNTRANAGEKSKTLTRADSLETLTEEYDKKISPENQRTKTPVGPGSIKVQKETVF